MSLQLAAASLTQNVIGLADIKQFSVQCREGALNAGHESAALILLAEKANGFYERYDGVAMTNNTLHTFVENLAAEIGDLRSAAAIGDAALIDALNLFAMSFSRPAVADDHFSGTRTLADHCPG